MAAADEYMLLSTTAGLIYYDPITTNPTFKRRFFLCWGLSFDDLLGLGDLFLSLSGHLFSPLLDDDGVYEFLFSILHLLASITLRDGQIFIHTKAESDEHHFRTSDYVSKSLVSRFEANDRLAGEWLISDAKYSINESGAEAPLL